MLISISMIMMAEDFFNYMPEEEQKQDTNIEQPDEKLGVEESSERLRTGHIAEMKRQLDSYEGPRSNDEFELRAEGVKQSYWRTTGKKMAKNGEIKHLLFLG